MLSNTSRSIILKRVPYGDADWIVHFFSRDAGRMSGIAKAARRSLRRFGSGLEPGAVVDLACSIRAHSPLVRIDESQVVFSTTGMMKSLARIEALGRCLQLAIAFLREHQIAVDKFELMEAYLRYISQADPPTSVRLGFELKWLALAGFEPHIHRCVSCGIEAEGDAAFSMEEGGLVCRSCISRGHPVLSLTPSMREAMHDMLSQPVGSEHPIQDERSISSLIQHYAAYILGHHLR